MIFILCTTEPHRLLDTILSRCQRFDFRRASVGVLRAKLEHICAGENLRVSTEALEYIARRASGSFRDAESLLEHIAGYAEGSVDLDLVQHLLGAAPAELVTRMIAAMLSADAGTGLRLINQALDQGADPRQFIGEVLDQLRGMLLLSAGCDDTLSSLGPATVDALRTLTGAPGFDASFLLQAIRSFTDAAQALRNAIRTELPLEVALVETITASTVSAGARRVADQTATDLPSAAYAPAGAPESAESDAGVERGASPEGRPAAGAVTQGEGEKPATSVSLAAVGAGAPDTEAMTIAEHEQASDGPEPTPEAEPATIGSDEEDSEPARVEEPPERAAVDEVEPISLAWVQGKWSQIISRMGAVDRSLQAILRSTYPVRVSGDVVVLGCESPFHRDTLGEEKRALSVERVMSELLEAPCRIQCVHEKGISDRSRNEPAQDEHLFSRMDRRKQREQELLNHPAVKALEQRGGQVTRVDLAEDES